MKRFICLTIVLFVFASLTFAQKSQVDRVSVPLTDPSKPAFIDISIMSGSITVRSYSGKEVIVEATSQLQYNRFRS